MGRYDIEEVEMEEDNQMVDGSYRRFAERDADQPRRSPIRRKDKLRSEEGMKPKARRNHKKISNKIKYNWQGE